MACGFMISFSLLPSKVLRYRAGHPAPPGDSLPGGFDPDISKPRLVLFQLFIKKQSNGGIKCGL
jgi:hypothetical protein